MVFSYLFKLDVEKYQEHAKRFTSQYKRIAEVKIIVSDTNNKSKLVGVDWSQSMEYFQTRQEKSSFYHTISASVNAAVAYSPEEVQGVGTISDVKSHKAAPTWASLNIMLNLIDVKDLQTLYCYR